MRGVMPWNKYDRQDFQKSVYKYVDDEAVRDIIKQRAMIALNERNDAIYNNDSAMYYENKDQRTNYKSLNYRNAEMLADSYASDKQPYTTKRMSWISNIRKTHRNDMQTDKRLKNPKNLMYTEYDPLETFFRQSNNKIDEISEKENESNGKLFNQENNEFGFNNQRLNQHYHQFSKDLWTKYAYKTFIIDRTKSGNIPIYLHYVRRTNAHFTEIRKIKGSKEVLFTLCL